MDSASANSTMMSILEAKFKTIPMVRKDFDAWMDFIRCLAHAINVTTQKLIKAVGALPPDDPSDLDIGNENIVYTNVVVKVLVFFYFTTDTATDVIL